MATKPKRKQPPPKRRIPVFAIVLGGIALIAIFVIVVSLGGGSDDKETTSAEGGVQQTQPVAVTGTALPELQGGKAQDPGVGKAIPDVRGKSFDGTPVDIVKDGTAKVIVFAAHWCPHCQKELPIIVDHLKATPMPGDVKLLGMSTSVNQDSPNYPPSEWLDKIGWTAPTIADDEKSTGAAAFGLPSFPFFVAVDKDGNVVERTSGEISMAKFDELVSKAAGRS